MTKLSILCLKKYYKIIFKKLRNQLNVCFVFQQSKMLKIDWVQLIKCEYFLCFFVFYDSNLNTFVLWTVGWTNQEIGRHRKAVYNRAF